MTSASLVTVCSLALMSPFVLQNAALLPLDDLLLLLHAAPVMAAIRQTAIAPAARVPRIRGLSVPSWEWVSHPSGVGSRPRCLPQHRASSGASPSLCSCGPSPFPSTTQIPRRCAHCDRG